MSPKEARMTSRGTATRTRIVEAAADLVRRNGAAGTSLEAVMLGAGVSKSQLYHYFADKEALVTATCRELGLDLGQLDFVSRDGTRFFDFFVPGVSSCYFPQFEAGRSLSQMLVEAVDGAPVEALQRVERTTFIQRWP